MSETHESPSIARQLWLEAAVRELRQVFAAAGYTVPVEVRVSIGWPRGSHGKAKAIGQCWDKASSSDAHAEMFISPALGDSATILSTLRHELVHATVGCKAGHKGAFKKCAVAVGLGGKMTATHSEAPALDWELAFVAAHGTYPSGSLNDATRKKQGTRLLKCECVTCGYVARVTKKWIAQAGAPVCGQREHGRMDTDSDDGDEE